MRLRRVTLAEGLESTSVSLEGDVTTAGVYHRFNRRSIRCAFKLSFAQIPIKACGVTSLIAMKLFPLLHSNYNRK